MVTSWDITYELGGAATRPLIPELDRAGHEFASQVAGTAAAKAKAAGLDVKTAIRRGPPAAAIRTIADEEEAQLIVVGSHGWSRVRQVLFGSVSSRVLHEAKQPVLIVKGDQAKEGADCEPAEETETVERHAA